MLLTANGALGPFFAALDAARRAQGGGLGALGYGPDEARYDIAAEGALWRLRRYGGSKDGPVVLIVPAPIKRPYIWDFAPSVSALRFCLHHGLRIYLLEWNPPSRCSAPCGLADYADAAVWDCLAAVSKEEGGAKPFLMGHSLGATLAAIFAALHPERLSGLVLLSAPLSLHPGVSHFRDALAAVPPTWVSGEDIVPGSALTHVSAMASPATFVWSRFWDSMETAGDRQASDLRLRVEHWALDEVPLSGKLVHEIFQTLYRENRFCEGKLAIAGRMIGPAFIRQPTLVVANAADEVAPPASATAFLEAMGGADKRLIEYPSESGVVLQHLGILVGRGAFARIWPQILSWIESHAGVESGQQRAVRRRLG